MNTIYQNYLLFVLPVTVSNALNLHYKERLNILNVTKILTQLTWSCFESVECSDFVRQTVGVGVAQRRADYVQ